MPFYLKLFTISLCVIAICNACTTPASLTTNSSKNWVKKELLFEDSGTEDWIRKWFLDGERARLDNGPMGMYYSAGPEPNNDTCHAVLWTQNTFSGDILIAFDYTRVDYARNGFVNILYFHATGKGGEDFPEDISRWNDKRKVPSMRTYYQNMNAYHISFATSRAADDDYIRLRRYDPAKRSKLAGSEILPDTFNTGLFKPFHTYHIEVARYGNEIEMHIQNKNEINDTLTLKWDTSAVPPCNEGRIGLRHMYTRASIYKDFQVWRIGEK